MAITQSQGFNISGSEPIETRINLTTSAMKEVGTSGMPAKYFAFNITDGQWYFYAKTQTSDATYGKYRKLHVQPQSGTVCPSSWTNKDAPIVEGTLFYNTTDSSMYCCTYADATNRTATWTQIGSGGAAVAIDNKTITKNSADEIQTVVGGSITTGAAQTIIDNTGSPVTYDTTDSCFKIDTISPIYSAGDAITVTGTITDADTSVHTYAGLFTAGSTEPFGTITDWIPTYTLQFTNVSNQLQVSGYGAAGATMEVTLTTPTKTYNPIDARFVPIDGTKIVIDATGKLTTVDEDTQYTAGQGLILTGTEFKYDTDVLYNKTEVDALLGGMASINIEVVTELPIDPTVNTIYLKPSATDPSVYEQHLYTASGWTTIGNTSLDLSSKQDKLIAGTNITIDTDGKTIHASGLSYGAGAGLTMSASNQFSVDTTVIATLAQAQFIADQVLPVYGLGDAGKVLTVNPSETGVYWGSSGAASSIDNKTIVTDSAGHLKTAIGGYKVEGSLINIVNQTGVLYNSMLGYFDLGTPLTTAFAEGDEISIQAYYHTAGGATYSYNIVSTYSSGIFHSTTTWLPGHTMIFSYTDGIVTLTGYGAVGDSVDCTMKTTSKLFSALDGRYLPIDNTSIKLNSLNQITASGAVITTVSVLPTTDISNSIIYRLTKAAYTISWSVTGIVVMINGSVVTSPFNLSRGDSIVISRSKGTNLLINGTVVPDSTTTTYLYTDCNMVLTLSDSTSLAYPVSTTCSFDNTSNDEYYIYNDGVWRHISKEWVRTSTVMPSSTTGYENGLFWLSQDDDTNKKGLYTVVATPTAHFELVSEVIKVDGTTTVLDTDRQIRAKSAIEVATFPTAPLTETIYRLTTQQTISGVVYKPGFYVHTGTEWIKVSSDEVNVDGITITKDSDNKISSRSAIEISAWPATPLTNVMYRLTADYLDPTTATTYLAGLYIYDSATSEWKLQNGGGAITQVVTLPTTSIKDDTLYALKRTRTLSNRYAISGTAQAEGWSLTDAGIYNSTTCAMFTWEVVAMKWSVLGPGGAQEKLVVDAAGTLYEFKDAQGNRKIIYSDASAPSCDPRLNLEKYDSSITQWYDMFDSDPNLTHLVEAKHYFYKFTGKLGRYESKDWLVDETIAGTDALYQAFCISAPSIEFRRYLNLTTLADTGWTQTYAIWH